MIATVARAGLSIFSTGEVESVGVEAVDSGGEVGSAGGGDVETGDAASGDDVTCGVVTGRSGTGAGVEEGVDATSATGVAAGVLSGNDVC